MSRASIVLALVALLAAPAAAQDVGARDRLCEDYMMQLDRQLGQHVERYHDLVTSQAADIGRLRDANAQLGDTLAARMLVGVPSTVAALFVGCAIGAGLMLRGRVA